jgi:hypothetical protein
MFGHVRVQVGLESAQDGAESESVERSGGRVTEAL